MNKEFDAQPARQVGGDEREAFEAWKTSMQPYGFNAFDVWQARAALAPVAVVQGWKMVPVKPSIEMVEAGYEASLGKPDRSAHARVIEQYDAMIGAVGTNAHPITAAELEALRRDAGRLAPLLTTLRESFPLLPDEGLDEEKHHCEWAIQQDRKRLHATIDALTQQQEGDKA